eukprot:Skav214768  [mRNA]  locus=scaffold1230:194642:195586:+ [translate_table: standard]
MAVWRRFREAKKREDSLPGQCKDSDELCCAINGTEKEHKRRGENEEDKEDETDAEDGEDKYDEEDEKKR